jgi:hypothetical protein
LTPILGIYASQITGHLSTNSYESIATVTVGSGGQSSISFTSIPSTYKHLQVRGIARSNSGSFGYMTVTFNSDTANNYSWHYLEGTGTTVSAGAAASQPSMVAENTTGSTQSSGIFGVFVIDILDYSDTNKYKTMRVLSGADANGSGYIDLDSGNWRSASAINNITLNLNAGNFVQYSQMALYGIKG